MRQEDAQAEKKASEQIAALLNDIQRKEVPKLLKSLRIFRDADVPLAVVVKLNLTDAQIETLAADKGGTAAAMMGRNSSATQIKRLRQVLTPKQQEWIEPYLQPSPMGGPGGPGRPDGPGGGPPEFGGRQDPLRPDTDPRAAEEGAVR